MMNQDSEADCGDLDRARRAVMHLARAAQVTRDDVAAMQRAIAGDVSLCRDEVDALFAIDRALGASGEDWTEFFVRTVTDHIVWASRPTGTVSDRQAEWLLGRVDETRTAASFAILVNVLQEADQVPAWFAGAVRKRAVSDWPGLVSLGQTGGAERLRAA